MSLVRCLVRAVVVAVVCLTVVACQDGPPSVTDTATESPAEFPLLSGPAHHQSGEPIRDGFVVPEETVLLGGLLPGESTTHDAMLVVTGDAYDVLRDLSGQAEGLGMNTAVNSRLLDTPEDPCVDVTADILECRLLIHRGELGEPDFAPVMVARVYLGGEYRAHLTLRFHEGPVAGEYNGYVPAVIPDGPADVTPVPVTEESLSHLGFPFDNPPAVPEGVSLLGPASYTAHPVQADAVLHVTGNPETAYAALHETATGLSDDRIDHSTVMLDDQEVAVTTYVEYAGGCTITLYRWTGKDDLHLARMRFGCD